MRRRMRMNGRRCFRLRRTQIVDDGCSLARAPFNRRATEACACVCVCLRTAIRPIRSTFFFFVSLALAVCPSSTPRNQHNLLIIQQRKRERKKYRCYYKHCNVRNMVPQHKLIFCPYVRRGIGTTNPFPARTRFFSPFLHVDILCSSSNPMIIAACSFRLQRGELADLSSASLKGGKRKGQ